jgi:Family of unknown function (DUF5924)/Protein of unknown function (DUF2914)
VSGVVSWARRWGVSVASFAGGLLTLFVFRRGVPHVAWIVGYLILLWLVFAALAETRGLLEERGHRLVVSAADYTIQSLYHGLLLFVLPAYWASTTLTSPNALFLVLLVWLAVIVTFDPWYRALVHPRPWLNQVFFVVAIFAALTVALPLVGFPPIAALLLSAWLAVMALTPALRRARDWSWPTACAVTTGAALVAMLVVSLGRGGIPPVPLSLADATMARDVENGEPRRRLDGVISAADLHAGGLVAYTAVYAPAGLRQPVQHEWRRSGRLVETVSLSPVFGGRRLGFRTYSRKSAFPEDASGRWTVDVTTSTGQLIGRLRFRVTP